MTTAMNLQTLADGMDELVAKWEHEDGAAVGAYSADLDMFDQVPFMDDDVIDVAISRRMRDIAIDRHNALVDAKSLASDVWHMAANVEYDCTRVHASDPTISAETHAVLCAVGYAAGVIACATFGVWTALGMLIAYDTFGDA